MSTLEKAVEIGARAHAGQVDKAGAPYLLHPLRSMLAMSTTEERIVAVLHDVVEDTPVTFDDLRAEGFSETVVEAVAAVTKLDSEIGKSWEHYEAFVLRAASNPTARRVKLADLRDNSDLSRIANPSEKDHARVAMYRRAIALLESLAAD
jgi:(p)ppGpp synthase/HD superfamily hydrolase